MYLAGESKDSDGVSKNGNRQNSSAVLKDK